MPQPANGASSRGGGQADRKPVGKHWRLSTSKRKRDETVEDEAGDAWDDQHLQNHGCHLEVISNPGIPRYYGRGLTYHNGMFSIPTLTHLSPAALACYAHAYHCHYRA